MKLGLRYVTINMIWVTTFVWVINLEIFIVYFVLEGAFVMYSLFYPVSNSGYSSHWHATSQTITGTS